jgi:hypothetical protein
MGDEEASFDVSQISHPHIHIWVQNPHLEPHDKYNRIGTGYPQNIRATDGTPYHKDLDLFFSGQITHSKRVDMVQNLKEFDRHNHKSLIIRTAGFTQGVAPDEYYRQMARAKVVPSPAGAVIPDSFRTFEAMELMAIPVADNLNSQGTVNNYWDWLFSQEAPFPKIHHADEWPTVVQATIDDYDELVQKQTVWWIKYKRDFAYKIREQLS